ncbi:MAG TPA: prepilin-type N-terminal cleavage/methylation domain-containing protein, partial [Rhodocyclaceae bacterium]|nr:prepilin-type N-terminal cleavage/methylation domain-containing protein [Rhodocyclaceae bacterium]
IKARKHGFTLVELAVVLFIISLLLGGLIISLPAQLDQKNNAETRQLLNDSKEALIGFAMTHSATDGSLKPYLPCPDTDNDGKENRDAGGGCTSQEGNLPWADLGLGQTDPWGNHLRYRVSSSFAKSDVGFSLATSPTLKVCDVAPAPSCTGVATSLPAIVLSHGKNGLGAINQSGAANSSPSGPDEAANADSDDTFVMHLPSDATGNTFDDIVVWLPSATLFNRMVTAGKLP